MKSGGAAQAWSSLKSLFVSVYECAIAHVWRAEDNLQESVLFFYAVGPR